VIKRNLLLLFILMWGTVYCVRDPFILPSEKDVGQQHPLKLTGTMKCGNRYAGILDDGKLATVVFNGMKAKGYFINNIGDRFIVISHNGITRKLTIE